MIRAEDGSIVRWAQGNGGIASGDGSLTEDDIISLCPAVGVYDLERFSIERVKARYAEPSDVVAYGKVNSDGFERLPEDAVWDAIQRAEEAIEQSCGRSFTRRGTVAALSEGFNELPVQDAVLVVDAELVGDRQCIAYADGDHVVEYGARPSAALRAATVKLAASYLRPRVGAENARGTSVNGVYVSYTLADGTDGSWTGIPDVDAFIERNRSRRAVVG